MKRIGIAAIAFVAGTALGTAAYAQGRHDDRPHGMPKDMPMAKDCTGAPAPAGRHDEKPHGEKKPAAKKSDCNAAAPRGQDAK